VRRTILLIATMAVMAVTYAGAALAQTSTVQILDANTLGLGESVNAYTTEIPSHKQVQTFTTEHDGPLTTVQVKMHRDPAGAPIEGIEMDITTVDPATGLPTPTVLASTTLPSSAIPLLPVNTNPSLIPLTTLTFENPATVEAGERYAIVIDAIAPDFPRAVLRWTTTLQNYEGGQGMWIWNDGSFFSFLPAYPQRGNASDQVFAVYLKPPDATAPTTTATPSPEPNEHGWNNSDTTISLSADDRGGSGVEKITYSASGAQTIEQKDESGESVEVTLDQEGTTTLTYYATDVDGNVEEQKSLTVKIDKTAPEVSSTSPSKYATGVAATASIGATFSESVAGIDPESISTDTFNVVQLKPTGNLPVSGTVSYDEFSQTVTFTPLSNLPKGAYRATITTGVQDKASNTLLNAYTWTFATAGPSKR